MKRELRGCGEVRLRSFSRLCVPNSELPYIACSDAEKVRAFLRIVNGNCDICLLTRGGFGISRWLDLVEWGYVSPLLKKKVFIGFSDATFLACALIKTGGKFLHGPMVNTLEASGEETQRAFFGYLRNGKLFIWFWRMVTINHPNLKFRSV